MKQKITIIIPTYNEKENISKIVPDIFEVFKRNKIDGNVIVVDDGSPDGTGDVVKDLMKKYNLDIIERKCKSGLGSAYIAGFKKALKESSDIIFEMDADYSHNPKYIPDFVNKINEGYDLVIGSRYIKGGAVKNWGPKRIMVSKGGNFVARTLSGLRTNDVTAGYRAYRKEIFKRLDLDRIRSSGYDFQIEMVFRTSRKGFKVTEIPITFVDRHVGSSKLARKDIIKFFMLCVILFFERIRGHV